MIDISKGRYWDLPWSLVDGCTPCSPGCDHCWAARRFTGAIQTHPERLSIPLKRRKPTVYAVWNDLFHEAVPGTFIQAAYTIMAQTRQHTFLVLTKRAQRMCDLHAGFGEIGLTFREGYGSVLPNVYHGLTVCNQQEADAKIPVFLQVPGKKFLSLEPMLSAMSLRWLIPSREWYAAKLKTGSVDEYDGLREISAVILGGETGPRARPTHPDWVRSIRDQCAAAGVPFFFKQWGEWAPGEHSPNSLNRGRTSWTASASSC